MRVGRVVAYLASAPTEELAKSIGVQLRHAVSFASRRQSRLIFLPSTTRTMDSGWVDGILRCLRSFRAAKGRFQ
jgi:hypothetical protein